PPAGAVGSRAAADYCRHQAKQRCGAPDDIEHPQSGRRHRKPGSAKKENPRGTEVILVVEDEEAIRTAICRSLRSLGYFVLEAKQGEDALEVLLQYHGPAHILIMAMVMP